MKPNTCEFTDQQVVTLYWDRKFTERALTKENLETVPVLVTCLTQGKYE